MKRRTRFSAAAMVCGATLFSITAHATDRKEWESVINALEKRSAKAAEIVDKPALTQNDKCYVERVFWDRSENGDYLPSIGSAKSDRDRINRLDEVINRVGNKYKSKGLRCNQHDESGAPSVVLADQNPAPVESKAIPAVQGQRLFGKWSSVSCEYFRDNQRLPDQCVIKKEWSIGFSAGKMLMNGNEFPVDYTDLPEAVDVRDRAGNTSRLLIGKNGADIVYLSNEAANRRITALHFARTAPADIQPQITDLGVGTASGKGLILEAMFDKFALPANADYTANEWNDLQKIQGVKWAKEGLKMNAIEFGKSGEATLAKLGKSDVYFSGARTMVLEGSITVGEGVGKIFEKDQFDAVVKNQFSGDTAIKKLRAGCPDEGAVSGSAIYEVTLKNKKPVYVLASTNSGGNSPNTRSSLLDFSLKNEQRWQCNR